MAAAGPLPFEVLGGTPGYVNFLDALNSWQLGKCGQGLLAAG